MYFQLNNSILHENNQPVYSVTYLWEIATFKFSVYIVYLRHSFMNF